MRICVIGECDTAAGLRGKLVAVGFALTRSELLADAVVAIEEARTELGLIEIDAVDCSLERHVINEIARQSKTDIRLRRTGGVRNDRKLRIVAPAGDEADQVAIEIGIVCGLQRLAKHPRRRLKFWRKA